jgi:hypothetical protein
VNRAQIAAALWAAGRSAWQLPPAPRRVYADIREKWGIAPYVVLAHRNFHKTMLAVTIADEECRRAPQRAWAIVLKTKDHAAKVIKPIMRYYLRDCPRALQPSPLKSDFSWAYPNGSGLFFFGADHEHIETARGRGFHGALYDEAGHQDNLKDNTRSIMLPALAKLGRGELIAISTPSTKPGHYFEEMCEEAKRAGCFSFVPASLNTDLSDGWRAARASECGGFDSLDYQREYECRFVNDPLTTVLPNVTEARISGADGKPALVQRVESKLNREWYRSMDIGGKHMTGVLWGFYESDDDSVRIVRELTDRNASEVELAAGIHDVERTLWPVRPEYLESWADTNNVYLLHNLDTTFGIRFLPTRKDEKMAQIGILRKMISEGRFVIDEGCTQLLATLKRAQWAATGKTNRGFAEDPAIGHADLLDAALYLVRNVHRRPYPKPLPTIEEHARMPWAERPLRTKGMRDLRAALSQEGWNDDEAAA